MPNDAQPMADAGDAGARLQQVAQALGVPVAAFFQTEPFDTVTAGAAELLRLWQAIRDPQDRDALLLAARGFVAREADGCLAAE